MCLQNVEFPIIQSRNSESRFDVLTTFLMTDTRLNLDIDREILGTRYDKRTRESSGNISHICSFQHFFRSKSHEFILDLTKSPSHR